MKSFFLISSLVFLLAACSKKKAASTAALPQVNALLDSLNATAARADFNAYFKLYSESSIFTGTDAMERRNKQQFMKWAKPIFNKARAWNFSSIDRHIYFDASGRLAWFDELLSTQMKICRGSGVVSKESGEWKIKQYIVSHHP